MDAVNSFSRWQFEDYIPRLKMKMAYDAFDRNLQRYGKSLSREQIAELSAKESNAAFGNLNTMFDSVPRSKTFKSLLRLATFAPDFLESRMRFVGQSISRYGGEQRAALIRGALAMYVAARVGNALINNGDAKWDPEHALSLVVNGKAYSLRTVQGDLEHAVTDPRGFIYNRLNPLTTRPIVEYLAGRDQFGRQKTALSQAKDLAKSVLPFGAQKFITTPDEGLMNSLLTSAGINARNDRTPIEEMVHKLYLKNIPDRPYDEEKQAETRKMRGQQSRLVIEFKGLGLKDAMKVYGKLQEETAHGKVWPHAVLELAELRPEMERKRALLEWMPEAERQDIADRLDSLLPENDWGLGNRE